MLREDITSRRYAMALFEVAKSLKRVDSFLNEFRELKRISAEDKKLYEFLHHPSISSVEKKRVIKDIFKEKVHPELIQLIYLLLEHNKIDMIRGVYYDYKYLVYKEKHKKIAYVTTAVEMNREETEALKKKLSKSLSCNIEVQNIINPDVLGGVYLRIGDRIIDGSIRGLLEDMKKNLLKESGILNENKTR